MIKTIYRLVNMGVLLHRQLNENKTNIITKISTSGRNVLDRYFPEAATCTGTIC